MKKTLVFLLSFIIVLGTVMIPVTSFAEITLEQSEDTNKVYHWINTDAPGTAYNTGVVEIEGTRTSEFEPWVHIPMYNANGDRVDRNGDFNESAIYNNLLLGNSVIKTDDGNDDFVVSHGASGSWKDFKLVIDLDTDHKMQIYFDGNMCVERSLSPSLPDLYYAQICVPYVPELNITYHPDSMEYWASQEGGGIESEGGTYKWIKDAGAAYNEGVLVIEGSGSDENNAYMNLIRYDTDTGTNKYIYSGMGLGKNVITCYPDIGCSNNHTGANNLEVFEEKARNSVKIALDLGSTHRCVVWYDGVVTADFELSCIGSGYFSQFDLTHMSTVNGYYEADSTSYWAELNSNIELKSDKLNGSTKIGEYMWINSEAPGKKVNTGVFVAEGTRYTEGEISTSWLYMPIYNANDAEISEYNNLGIDTGNISSDKSGDSWKLIDNSYEWEKCKIVLDLGDEHRVKIYLDDKKYIDTELKESFSADAYFAQFCLSYVDITSTAYYADSDEYWDTIADKDLNRVTYKITDADNTIHARVTAENAGYFAIAKYNEDELVAIDILTNIPANDISDLQIDNLAEGETIKTFVWATDMSPVEVNQYIRPTH